MYQFLRLNPNLTYFICLTMDATTYSQILHYLVLLDTRYPHDIPMEKGGMPSIYIQNTGAHFNPITAVE